MALRFRHTRRICLHNPLKFPCRMLATETASTPTPATPPTPQQQQQQQQKQQQHHHHKQHQSQSPITWTTLAVTAALGTAGLAYYSYERERRIKEIASPKAIGRADIGGPFSLTRHDGQTFTHEDLLGRWSLIYFGFTMCPDICPDELTKLSEALTILEKRGRRVSATTPTASSKDNRSDKKGATITPIFISIDPERDTPARSGEYAQGFHPAFIGLSGSKEDVTATAKKYRVYFSKDETPGDDYLVDHSIISYLMDPNGEFQEFYGKNASAVEVASRIEAKMLAWKPS